MSPKAILAGGSGLLGRAVAQRLLQLGWDVVILTRKPGQSTRAREVHWDGETEGDWTAELEGATALVNFTGRSINCVFTLKNSREIMESRLNAMRVLGKVMVKCDRPPAVWVQCSATGYYGSTGLGLCYEDTPAGTDFLGEVCVRWEEALNALDLPDTRRVVLRLGPVLDRHGGMYPTLARLTKFFLGGTAGTGQQGVAWVHRKDVVEIFLRAIQRSEMTGVYNVCGPEPVTNEDFMRTLRHSLIRPWVPPAPASVVRWVARNIMKTDPVLVLGGRSCSPARLQDEGYQFEFPDLSGALRDLAKWEPK